MRISKDPKERKAEIILVAREMFEKNGIENTLVSDIVGKIGVAQGLFYYYFKSKDDVVKEVINDILSEIDDMGAQIINSGDINFYQKLVSFIDMYFNTADRFGKELINEIRNSENSKYLSDTVYKLNLKYMDTLMNLGVREGIIKLKYPNDMLLMILNGVSSIIRQKSIERGVLLTLIEQGLNLESGVLRS